MHEMALAEAVVATALEEAERHGISSISKICVRVGELQSIDRDVFAFALEEMIPAAEPRLASTKFQLDAEPARFRCRPCGTEFSLSAAAGADTDDATEAIHFIPELAHTFLRCSSCGSPDFDVVAGRGVSVASIEGD